MGEDKKKSENSAQLIDDWDSLPLDPNADDWDDEPIGFFNESDQLSAEQKTNFLKIAETNEITAGFEEIVTCEKKAFDLSLTGYPTVDTAHGNGPHDHAPEPPDISIADSLLGPEHFKEMKIDIKGLAFGDSAAQEDDEDRPTGFYEDKEKNYKAASPSAIFGGSAPKNAKTKIIILTLAVLLAAAGLGLGIYKLFLKADLPPAPDELSNLMVEVSPQPAQPGEIELALFYLDIPDQPQNIIVEMQVTLKYENQKNKAAIETQITAIRDLIYRLAQSNGQKFAADNTFRQQFCQELMKQANQLLGDGHISDVQINQFKVLP